MAKINTSDLALPAQVSECRTFSLETSAGTASFNVRRSTHLEALGAVEYGDMLAQELDSKPVTVQDQVVFAPPKICAMASLLAMVQTAPSADVYSERELIALFTQPEAWGALNEAYFWSLVGDEPLDEEGDDEDVPQT